MVSLGGGEYLTKPKYRVSIEREELLPIALAQNIRLKPRDLQQDEHIFSLAEIEQFLGHTLPLAMEALLRPSGKPASFDEDVRIKGIARNQMTDKEGRREMGLLFGMHSGRNGIAAIYNSYQGRFARRCTPFAKDEKGNLFVVDTVTWQVKF